MFFFLAANKQNLNEYEDARVLELFDKEILQDFLQYQQEKNRSIEQTINCLKNPHHYSSIFDEILRNIEEYKDNIKKRFEENTKNNSIKNYINLLISLHLNPLYKDIFTNPITRKNIFLNIKNIEKKTKNQPNLEDVAKKVDKVLNSFDKEILQDFLQYIKEENISIKEILHYNLYCDRPQLQNEEQNLKNEEIQNKINKYCNNIKKRFENKTNSLLKNYIDLLINLKTFKEGSNPLCVKNEITSEYIYDGLCEEITDIFDLIDVDRLLENMSNIKNLEYFINKNILGVNLFATFYTADQFKLIKDAKQYQYTNTEINKNSNKYKFNQSLQKNILRDLIKEINNKLIIKRKTIEQTSLNKIKQDMNKLDTNQLKKSIDENISEAQKYDVFIMANKEQLIEISNQNKQKYYQENKNNQENNTINNYINIYTCLTIFNKVYGIQEVDNPEIQNQPQPKEKKRNLLYVIVICVTITCVGYIDREKIYNLFTNQSKMVSVKN